MGTFPQAASSVKYSVAFLSGVVSAVLAGPAFAASQITDLSVSGIVQTQLFDKSAGANGEWSLPGAPPASTALNNSTVISSNDVWFINPFASIDLVDGNINWAGNPLVADNSSGGRADALFGDGGTMTIRGDLYDGNLNLIADDALLLTATIGGFQILETSASSNFFDIIGTATVTATGGLLYGNNSDAIAGGNGMGFFGEYKMNLSGAEGSQDGGDLNDFSSNVDLLNSLQFNISTAPAPEPVSLVCLASAFSYLLLSRGNHGKRLRSLR